VNICDEIKLDVLCYYAGNGETFVSDDASRRDKAVPDKSYTRGLIIILTLL
jgi:hypothetical protein